MLGKYYRMESFQDAINVYKDLKSSQDSIQEQNDLQINKSAVDAQLEWQGLGFLASSRIVQKDDSQAFERAYNAACGCIARSKWQEAEILLARAKRTLHPIGEACLTSTRTMSCFRDVNG